MPQAIFPGIGCCDSDVTISNATPIGWYMRENRTELRAIPSSPSNVFAFIEGLVTQDDGLGGIYTWVNSNTDADDGTTVIEPDDSTGAGRWIKRL